MKLLVDANLSPKLVKKLAGFFPGSVHLFDLPLPRNASDISIWNYAKDNGFDIVTTDGDDYPPLARRLGPPPKVILLKSWQFPTRIALTLLRDQALVISDFGMSNRALLVLSQ